jgi:hypothetical protein
MFSAEAFIKTYGVETDICVRLASKMPAGGLDYRPTPGQRNTLELMRYISKGPYNGVRRIVAGDWTLGKPAVELSKDMPPSDFAAQMRWQNEEVARIVRAADPVDLEQGTLLLPWGETAIKGEALVNHPLKWLVGYRMQLFLYLKAAGAAQLATPDLWRLTRDPQ